MAKKHPGFCALCGEYFDDLSFEHIPPRSAFNKFSARAVSGKDFIGKTTVPWELKHLPYDNLQRGMGKYSLCSVCNSTAGVWYVKEYKKISHIFVEALAQITSADFPQCIEIKEMYPLRFIKQVICMFCSVNNQESLRAYNMAEQEISLQDNPLVQMMIESKKSLYQASKLVDELRRFVLDKNASGLDSKKFKVCMYVTKSSLHKLNGLSSVMKIENNTFSISSEISTFPLGFILYFNPTEDLEYKGVDITNFANCNYDDIASVRMPVFVYEMNTWVPLDYRTKAEIQKGINEAEDFLKNR